MVVAKFEVSRIVVSLVVLFIVPVAIKASLAEEKVIDNEPTCTAGLSTEDDGVGRSCLDHQKYRIPDGCQLVYAKVPAEEKSDMLQKDQWATYTLTPRKKGTPVLRHGDIVIQWTDPIPESFQRKDEHSYARMLREYTWNGHETGGQYESTRVESVVTGIGMTSRTTIKEKGNVLPLVPRVDDGSITRFDSPGAGAVTRYHNFTWWFNKDLKAGDELVYNSEGKMASALPQLADAVMERTVSQKSTPGSLSLEYLTTNGFCMDNMRPKKSRIKGAGRGAFATRDLLEKSVVAPVPVALIHRDELSKPNALNQQQLLLNYCLGHQSSDWLLFPFSPIVNLVNHYNEPNVELRWSAASNYNHSIAEIDPTSTMLLELVATRPIKMGEEIYLDYGRDWEDSWWKHVREIWKPIDKHYTPSYVMDDAIKMIRTEQEQKDHPYPENIFTSCFYRYSDRSEEERNTAKKERSNDSLTSFKWKLTKGLYDLKNLRPCRLLKRMEDKSGRSGYGVRMLNRPGLSEEETIPKGETHIVTHVPRAAIRFSDKAGTTDQHLKNAFRHEIGLPDDLVPFALKV